jgi:hypothetical protein
MLQQGTPGGKVCVAVWSIFWAALAVDWQIQERLKTRVTQIFIVFSLYIRTTDNKSTALTKTIQSFILFYA